MPIERFSQWFFTQPEIIQRLVVYGPPLAVSALIGLGLGNGARLTWLSWLFNPAIASAIETARRIDQDEPEPDWTDTAKASVDELVARRGRGLR